MLSPYVTGYAVISLPKLAAELRAQGMTVDLPASYWDQSG